MFKFYLLFNNKSLEVRIQSNDYNRPGMVEINGDEEVIEIDFKKWLKEMPGIISRNAYDPNENLAFPADIHHVLSNEDNEGVAFLVNMTGKIRKLSQYRYA